MKRIITLVSAFAILAVSLLCTSCIREKEKEYTFSYSAEYAIEDEAVVETLMEYLKTVSDGFFSKPCKYFGYSANACAKAANDFELNMLAVDGDYIQSMLKGEEYLCLVLKCADNNVIVAYICWTSKESGEVEEE